MAVKSLWTGDTLTFHTDVRQIVTITYKERVEFEGTKAVYCDKPDQRQQWAYYYSRNSGDAQKFVFENACRL